MTAQTQKNLLPSAYNHADVEHKIYEQWLASDCFNPDNLEGQPYTIIMPPPNANAPLHVGHALGITIEDILIRYQRMRGRKALWLPGTDHAGFETQVVFEKKLEKEGRSRFEMNREQFYKEVWNFVQANKHISEAGLKRLGASCDWSRNIFTLDPRIVKVVYETFKKMYEDGLAYRGNRICNWCPKHQTGLADLETKYEERQEPFYYLKYGPFTIGTARPETKFGDKYVVMHPNDERYKKYKHREKIELEWINGKITATIIKDHIIDIEFGTGVMTITPAHDPVDFEIAQRHNLDIEKIIDLNDKLLPIAGEFAGLHIKKARPLIIEKLQKKGLLEKTDENYKHNIQLCYKCGSVIEPQVIPQWYIKTTAGFTDSKTSQTRPSLRDMAVTAVTGSGSANAPSDSKNYQNQKVKILGDRFEKIFLNWMNELRDWPISRQIWWGIPIPAKYCHECAQKYANDWKESVFIDIEDKLTECPKCNNKLTKDPDTFDTWFSSGQWPYATLMARSQKDFETYFPTQIMETGWDILFFWVARMIMLSLYRTDKTPFETVYLHGLVRDKDRQKMSKSKGNVTDPLNVIDTYGTDALRFALVFSTAAGNDIPLSEDKIKGMKHFANKIWNIARFVLGTDPKNTSYDQNKLTKADIDILEKLNKTVAQATEHLDNFRLHEAAQHIYQFTWHEFADIYIEASKSQLQNIETETNTKAILLHCLIIILKLLHPFMPFITEELWKHLDQKKLLIISAWPQQ